VNTTRRRLALVTGALALATVAAACVPITPGPPVPPPPPEVSAPAGSPTIGVETGFVTGLAHPWDIAFVDATTGIFTERAGKISKFDVATGASTPIATIPDVFNSPGEDGLMGIAVDPAFASGSPFIYVCMSKTGGGGGPGPNVLRRYTLDVATPSLTLPVDVIMGMGHSNFHDGCRVRFQPSTRNLFWSMGDAGIGTSPQDLSQFGGKILKATVDTSGNLVGAGIYGGYVYTYGHRNPQGIAFKNSDVYSVEHGPGVNDEVNKLVVGGNGGWDPVPGYNQGVPMTDTTKFKTAMLPVWRSGDGGTVAPSGGEFLSGAQWGSWDGALVLAYLKGRQLKVLLMNPDGSVSGQFTMPGTTGTRLRAAVQGPDGNLYVSTDDGGTDGAIWKVVPA
jgi:glucose/arabinose dehydrogenase